MVDLTGQYQPIKDEIDSAIQDVINSAAFINGPVVREFSSNLQNYLGVKHVVPCAKWYRCFTGCFNVGRTEAR